MKWDKWYEEFDVPEDKDWHGLKSDAVRIMRDRLRELPGFNKARYSIAWGYRDRPSDIDADMEFPGEIKWWSTEFQSASGAVKVADTFIENVESGEHYRRYTNIEIIRMAIIVMTPRQQQE